MARAKMRQGLLWLEVALTMKRLALLTLGVPALRVGVAFAAKAGDLDPSFDGDGKRVLPYGFTPAEVLATLGMTDKLDELVARRVISLD